MKSLASLLLIFLSTTLVAETCYPFKSGTLCVPQIGEKKALTFSNGELPFSPFIKKYFNGTANYSGPNCYNTAFLAASLLNEAEKRYFSPEEFEVLLKKYYEEVPTLKSGDLVVYEANSGRGHVAYYLGDNLVFHKKSYNKNYLYRITTLEEVGLLEKGEWAPGPWEDDRPIDDAGLGKSAKAYYRLRAIPLSDNFSARDKAWLDLLNHITVNLIKDGPNWSVGKNMGLITENLLDKLETASSKEKLHPVVKARITSLKDGVFQALEEMYFKRARGSDDVARINSEICFTENEYLNTLMLKTSALFKEDAAAMKAKLRTADRKVCKIF